LAYECILHASGRTVKWKVPWSRPPPCGGRGRTR